MASTQAPSAPYRPSGYVDEAIEPDGRIRPAYRCLIEEIVTDDLGRHQDEVERALANAGVSFGGGAFTVDPVPRLITSAEWEMLETGLTQRVRALQAFLADIYSEQRILDAGVMRRSILDRASHYEPAASGWGRPVVAHLAGPDLIRDGSGFLALEDNLRFPAGLAFALAARDAVGGRWEASMPRVSADRAWTAIGETLRSLDPTGTGEPGVAVLSEGPESTTWFEHRRLAELLGIGIVTPAELEVVQGRLHARRGNQLEPVDVLYNRSDTDRISGHGGLTPLGEVLSEPLRRGTLACANSFGSGIADDKAVHCYTEEMIRFYLDEEPRLRIPRSFDLGDPEQAAQALELDRPVIKPRGSLGGRDIVLGPRASDQDLARARHAIREDPDGYVAQEMIELSTHPTVVDGRLEPRHLDLRPFVVSSGDRQEVLPVALSRYAKGRDDLVVNSTQGGGAKDTWILRDRR